MTELTIRAARGRKPEAVVTAADEIAERLLAAGVRFERVPLPSANLDREANQDEVIEAYREPLDDLMHRHGFAGVDVVSLWPQHPERDALRDRLAAEHRHRAGEGCLFVDGRGAICLRAHHRIHALLCRRGDFVCLPPDTPHWLDPGHLPDFRAIRLFAATERPDASSGGAPVPPGGRGQVSVRP